MNTKHIRLLLATVSLLTLTQCAKEPPVQTSWQEAPSYSGGWLGNIGPEDIRNELRLSVPIIALTADVTTVDVEKCKAVGMNDYISKPIMLDDLWVVLGRWLPSKD